MKFVLDELLHDQAPATMQIASTAQMSDLLSVSRGASLGLDTAEMDETCSKYVWLYINIWNVNATLVQESSLRYVGALRTLALSIISTSGSLFWTLVILVILVYSFGVVVTQLVVDHCRVLAVEATQEVNAVPMCPPELSRYWASVPASRRAKEGLKEMG